MHNKIDCKFAVKAAAIGLSGSQLLTAIDGLFHLAASTTPFILQLIISATWVGLAAGAMFSKEAGSKNPPPDDNSGTLSIPRHSPVSPAPNSQPLPDK